jgi:hypothetical protein
MLDNFLNELEELLHSAPLSKVDILPLINQYTEGQDNNEIVNTRLRITEILTQLKTTNHIGISESFYFAISNKSRGQYSDDPIYACGTLKFEKEYHEKRKPPVQPITITTHGDNSPVALRDVHMGDIQSESLNFESLPKQNPAISPIQMPKTIFQKYWFKAASWILDHIIAVIIFGLILGYLLFRLGWD